MEKQTDSQILFKKYSLNSEFHFLVYACMHRDRKYTRKALEEIIFRAKVIF